MFRAQQNAFDDVVGKSNLQLGELGNASSQPAYNAQHLLTCASHSQGD